jgi:TRAP-type C4-dicarboxylate transport system substrate-binding protein
MLGDWCANIAKDSSNRLQCQIFPAMQLGGSPPQLFDQAKDGVADVVWTVAGYSAGRFPKSEIFELPFMMTNAESTSRAAWDFVQKHAMDEYSQVKLLAVHVHGPGNIFTKSKPIKTLADFKGMKLRAPTRLTNKMLAMLGDWCANIAKDSSNRLQCQIFPAMQLGGSPPQLFDQAKDGVADVVWTVAGYSAGRFPKSEIFELPFMMTNAESTSRAAWDFVQKHAMDEYSQVKLLAVHVHGPGNIFTKSKPIKTLADFKGMKLRAPTRLTNKMLAMLGATPVGMPVPQVPEALSKGVIDGAVIPYEVAPGLRVHELTKFVAEPDRSFEALYTTVFIVPMNKAKYDSLPNDLKAVIDKNSGREFSAFLGRTQSGNDVPGRATFASTQGYTINQIPKAELEKWRQATDRLDDEWAEEMSKRGADGKALLSSARELIKSYTK